jgi:Tol biopolymer transport system component
MNLWRARFGVTGLSDYEQITSSTEANIQARPDPTGKRVAYSSVRVSLDLWDYDLADRRGTQLTSETTQEDWGRLSPDGQWLAFASNRLGDFQLWLRNQKDGTLTQVTGGAQASNSSRWSPDGRFLYYFDSRSGMLRRYEVSTGNATPLVHAPGPGAFFSLSSDGRFVVVSSQDGIDKIELSSGRREVLIQAEKGTTILDPSISPDDRWVAYYVQRGNYRSIWVTPFMGGAARQITSGLSEDSHPSWSPDSKLIYFLRNHQDIHVVPLAGGAPRPITNYHSFSILLDYPMVSFDGKKIIFTRNDKGGDIFLLESPE